jgi:hypothetical protein
MSQVASTTRRPAVIFWLPVASFLALLALEIACILWLNRGVFTYTLDDAYIHLAVAENIAQGGYGVNPGEYAAPSSSIAWPFLLAPFSALKLDALAPLLINALAGAGVLLVAAHIVWQAGAWLAPTRRAAAVCMILLALIPLLNLPGLALTGMEHLLQMLLALLILAGLLHEQRTGKAAGWLVAAIVLAPLVRYECLAVSIPALAYLLWRRHFLAALSGAALLGAALLAFSLFLESKGLGFLPSSAVAKSSLAGAGGLVQGAGQNLSANLYTRQAALLACGAFGLLFFALFAPTREGRSLAAWAGAATGLHLVFGRVGGFSRYELYIWAILLLCLVYLSNRALPFLARPGSMLRFGLLLAGAVVLLGTTYLSPLLRSPTGANNIYQQHYQMHRFAVDYLNGPVAVTDLGWVAYRNDNYVLDLGGLASPAALAYRRTQSSGEWMDRLARQHGVKLAMLFKSAQDDVPANWIPVAEMALSRAKVTPVEEVVIFYAVEQRDVGRIAQLLEAFQYTLPDGIPFTLCQE